MTPRQRRVMRKAIRMAKAGQREIASEQYHRVLLRFHLLIRGTPAYRVTLARAHRALDLLAMIDEVRLVPREVMMLHALRRASRRLNARYT